MMASHWTFQSLDLSFDPVGSHTQYNACTHTLFVNPNMDYVSVYTETVYTKVKVQPVHVHVHRAQRAVAGPTNNQWEYVFRFWIWYISINELHLKFWQVLKHQGATMNGHTVVHAYATQYLHRVHNVHHMYVKCESTHLTVLARLDQGSLKSCPD